MEAGRGSGDAGGLTTSPRSSVVGPRIRNGLVSRLRTEDRGLPSSKQHHNRLPRRAVRRRAVDDGDADVVVVGGQDVGAVAGRLHPALHEQLDRFEAGGEVLAGEAEGIAARLEPDERRAAVGRFVRPVLEILHVLHPVAGGEHQPRIEVQRREALLGAVGVHFGEDRVGRNVGGEKRCREREQEHSESEPGHRGFTLGDAVGTYAQEERTSFTRL